MTDLTDIREQLDEIDAQIQQLFERRMRLTDEVAAIKIRTKKPVFDKDRETEKLDTLAAHADNAFNARGIRELFGQIMSIGRKRQYQLIGESDGDTKKTYTQVDSLPVRGAHVVFQGVEGAYSYAAMQRFFGSEILSFHADTWEEAIGQVAAGAADYAVLPIENSTAGAVGDIYDLISAYPVYIVGEQILPIEHKLLGLPGTVLSDIRTVISHPQGLMQCKDYLNKTNWMQREVLNTAVAAGKVAQDKDNTQAAIASADAGRRFGLVVLNEEPIATLTNETRFIIVSGSPCYVRSADKISICFEIAHESGSLYNLLSHFIYNDLNLTKIESRPIVGRNWEYRFFVDFGGSLDQPAVKSALRGAAAEAGKLKVLGNY